MEPTTAVAPEPLLISIEEASRLLGISPSTLRRMTASRQMRAVRARSRLLFSLGDIRKFAQGTSPEVSLNT